MPGEKILIVDDSDNIREIFMIAFEEFSILTATNAEEALNILRKPNDIDLIVLDVMMPGMNGLELLKEIKELNRDCRIVIMTGYSSKDIVVEALRLHADEYIEKPFDVENVKAIFKRLLEEKNRQKVNFASGQEKIGIAQRLIQRNYNKSLSLQDVSKELYLNYKYLSRLFKEKTGVSFNEYKVRLKIDSAKEFLKASNCNIGEIAYKVGYQNPDSFMKMFKRSTGFTPSEYRSKTKRKKELV